jgi:hypothetical protein
VIYKESDGSARNKKEFSASLLNESNGLNETEIMSIYSCPSKCNYKISGVNGKNVQKKKNVKTEQKRMLLT